MKFPLHLPGYSCKHSLRLIPVASVAIWLLLLVPVATGQSVTQTLTIDEALSIAEEGNLDLLTSAEAVKDARQQTRQSLANLLPSVFLEASQTRTKTPLATGFSLQGLPFDAEGQYNDAVDSFTGKVTGTVPLVDPRSIAEYRVARTGYKAEELNHEDTIQNVLQVVAEAYLTHLRNLGSMEVVQANIERDKTLLELAREQVKAGVANPIDETRAEVQLAADEKQKLQVETLLMGSELRIKQLLDLDLGISLRLDPVPVGEPPSIPFDQVRLDRIVEQRPDYKRAQMELKRNRLAKKAASWERFPVLTAFGEYGYATEWALDDDHEETWMIGVSLRMPVFEGFKIDANKRRASIFIRQQELAIRSIEQTVGANYRLAVQNVNSRYQQIEIVRKRVALNERELYLARIRFEQGVADNSDMVTAQANLAVATDDLVEANYQYLLSRLDLARLEGNVRAFTD